MASDAEPQLNLLTLVFGVQSQGVASLPPNSGERSDTSLKLRHVWEAASEREREIISEPFARSSSKPTLTTTWETRRGEGLEFRTCSVTSVWVLAAFSGEPGEASIDPMTERLGASSDQSLCNVSSDSVAH